MFPALLSSIFALVLASTAHGAAHETIKIASLANNCGLDFVQSGFTFDLCPLFRDHAHISGAFAWGETTPPTKITKEIKWNLAGAQYGRNKPGPMVNTSMNAAC
jgi:hypothetical protein